jgi:RNA polymerase sigma-70 factor (ECF subfamily)
VKIQKNSQKESEWVEKIRYGDAEAFEYLFKKYCQSLINFARYFVQDIQIAEDIIQDVFLKTWSNHTKLNPSLNIKTYLFTAVKHQALNHLRHEKTKKNSIADLQLYIAPVKTPENGWKEKELTLSIQQAVKELPEKCRLIFIMNRFDQLTYTEIADILNLSIKTVETQMGRAFKYLRKKLNHFL